MAHLSLDVDGAGPASTTILTSCLVGEPPSDLPAISNPLSCLSLLANSSGDGHILSEGVPDSVTLLLPTLGIIFILAIWNEAATNQHS